MAANWTSAFINVLKIFVFLDMVFFLPSSLILSALSSFVYIWSNFRIDWNWEHSTRLFSIDGETYFFKHLGLNWINFLVKGIDIGEFTSAYLILFGTIYRKKRSRLDIFPILWFLRKDKNEALVKTPTHAMPTLVIHRDLKNHLQLLMTYWVVDVSFGSNSMFDRHSTEFKHPLLGLLKNQQLCWRMWHFFFKYFQNPRVFSSFLPLMLNSMNSMKFDVLPFKSYFW